MISKGSGRHRVALDTIAEAICSHAPERAVEIWQKKAEDLIALVKPKAYMNAAVYLRKAKKTLCQINRQADWEQYLQDLKNTHFRKTRLMKILNGFEHKPILKKQDAKNNQKSRQTELFQDKND